MTVFLCGFMGCGKTTAGQILAKKLGTAYIDMDDYIVEKENMTIPEIFKEKGEPYFRQKETEAITELSRRDIVIACGGGAMISDVNAEIARENGIVIFLDVPFEVCYSRICNDTNRPIASGNSKEQLEKIYNTRYGIYKNHSSMIIDADNSPENIAENIKKAVISGIV